MYETCDWLGDYAFHRQRSGGCQTRTRTTIRFSSRRQWQPSSAVAIARAVRNRRMAVDTRRVASGRWRISRGGGSAPLSAATNRGPMSKRLRPILIGVWGLLLTPLVATILEKWLEENFFSDPNAIATTVFKNLIALAHQTLFQFTLVFFTGIVIGFSFDWVARKSDENRASELRSLGSKFRSLSDIIKIRTTETSSEWPNNVRDLRPDIASAFISAKKFDLWVPGERAYQLPDASFLCEYLRFIGRLLEDGHFADANREALAWKPFFNRAR
jgi:hypothetical protein